LNTDYQLDVETLVAPDLVRETKELIFSCDLDEILKEQALPSVKQQALMLLNDLREHLEKQSV
jgi:hypothetical protein